MKYRAEIDGLRALAVIPVILYHAGFKLFGGGYVGVDVFFVISGYLITSIILAELELGTFSLIHFYERRARRILPALFLVMFACLPFAWFWLLPDAMKIFSESLIAVPTFVSNIFFYRQSGYFDVGTVLAPLIHTWSLAVEEQYYVLFPLFLMLTWKLGSRRVIGLLVVVFVISLLCAQWLTRTHSVFPFYMLPTRAWELLIGAFIAYYYSRQNIKKHHLNIEQLGSLIGFILVMYAVFSYSDRTPFPGLYTLVPTLGAALIIIFATHKTIVGKLLGSKLFVAIGLVSYSAYLWHQPIFAFVKERSLGAPSMYLMTALAVLSFGLAYLSWKYVERPFRNKHRFTRIKVFVYGALCSLLFIGIGLAGYLTDGFANRVTGPTLSLLNADVSQNNSTIQCVSLAHPSDTCNLNGKVKIIGAILGDSHADALAKSLDLELQKNNLAVKNFTNTGCPPIFDVYTNNGKFNCSMSNHASYEHIRDNPEFKYIIIASRWTYWFDTFSNFDNGEGGIEHADHPLEIIEDGKIKNYSVQLKKSIVKQKDVELIKKYLQLNKMVILIYPIPEMGWDVPHMLAKQSFFDGSKLTTDTASTSYAVYKARNKEAIQMLDSIGINKNLIRIYPDKIFCDTFVKDRCVAQVNGVPIYSDDDHLNTIGNSMVASQVVKYFTLE